MRPTTEMAILDRMFLARFVGMTENFAVQLMKTQRYWCNIRW